MSPALTCARFFTLGSAVKVYSLPFSPLRVTLRVAWSTETTVAVTDDVIDEWCIGAAALDAELPAAFEAGAVLDFCAAKAATARQAVNEAVTNRTFEIFMVLLLGPARFQAAARIGVDMTGALYTGIHWRL